MNRSFPTRARQNPLPATLATLVVVLAVAAGSIEAAEPRGLAAHSREQIEASIAEKASRTPAERKLDSHLVRALRQKRQQRIAPASKSPLAAFQTRPDGRILVDMRADVQPALLSQIEAGGGTVVSRHQRFQSIRAWVTLELAATLAAQPGVRRIRPAEEAMTSVGPKTSQGDITHQAAEARSTLVVDGTGVKVGVLSDSVDFLAYSQSLGELPPVVVLPGQAGLGSGEGTAMLEIVHDLAPGAQLYFATAFDGIESFAQNILDLHAAGCRVVVDDIIYFAESPFQDGLISQAINEVSAAGTLYFSAAGNSGNFSDGTSSTWEGDFRDGGPATLGRGGRVHDFGGSTFNVINPGTIERVDLFWTDPLGGSTNDYDVYVLNRDGSVFDSSTNVQDGDDDPYEAIPHVPYLGEIIIVKHSGENRFLHLSGGRAHLSISTPGATRGHNASGASNAFCVAASWVRSPAIPFTGGDLNPVERFSSDGPRRIFFEPNGTPITPGNFSATGGRVLQKPDLTAADGVATSVPGFDPFFGTSAAAPHAAAIAALLMSYNQMLTPPEIRLAMESTALDIEGLGVERDSGAGIVMALAALRAPATPLPRLVVQAASLSGGNGNGRLDPDECGDVFITLRNLISPAGQTATGIVAELRSTTPGVVVDPTPRVYPDILPAESAVNPLPFRISTEPGYSCVTPATFALRVTTANAGVFNLSFTLASTPPTTGDTLTFIATNLPQAIPDQGFIDSSIVVSNLDRQLERVRVAVHVTHTFDSDLVISLISPNGTAVELTSNNGGSGANYGTNCSGPTFFDDAAPLSISAAVPPFSGAFRPEQPLSAYIGQLPADANGTWRLRVRDVAAEDVGILQCWSLETTPIRCAPGGGACLRPPLITSQPENLLTTNGLTALFTVAADGVAPLFYQWRFNITNLIADATNASLLLPHVTLEQAGAYSVVVSNLYGASASQSAQLTVVAPPSIVHPPPDVFTTNGYSVRLAVEATGTPPLFYQWFFNQTNALANATNAELILVSVDPSHAGRYSVRVANSYGFVLSQDALLQVAVPPFITQQPRNAAAASGGNAAFAVVAEGTSPLSYQWYFNETNRLAGATAPTLLLTDLTTNLAGGYSVIVSNAYGTATSTEAELVVAPPTLSTNAVNLVSTGAVWKYLDSGLDQGTAWRTATFNDSAWPSGPAQLGYGDGDEATVLASGPATNRFPTAYFRRTFVLPEDASFTNAILRLLCDDGAAVYLNGVEVFRTNLPAGPLTFATLASTGVSGAAESNFVAAAIDPLQLRPGTNQLAVEVHQVNATSSDLSFDLELRAERRLPPFILEAPASIVANQGATATFKVVASGTAPLSYQWFFQITNALPGATNNLLTILNAAPVNAGDYAVRVSNPLGTVTSGAATLTVLDTHTPPEITLTSPSANAVFFADAGPILLEASASDTGGSIAQVTFFADGLPLETVTELPYRASWLDAPLGVHRLWAVATDLTGARGTSAVAQVTVRFATNVASLVSTGAVWNYLDTGADAGTAWRALDFDDRSWPSGPAELGYGDTADGRPEATVVSFGPNPHAKYITTYFRRSFVLTDPASFTNLAVRLLRDDGAVVYLNETEVFRSNLPTGNVTFATLATASVGNADETRFFTNTINPSLLRNGSNVLAVEVHQNAANSSDLSFDLALSGRRVFAPVILASPLDLVVRAGDTATFNVQAEGTQLLRYQWFFNGNPLPGQTASTLTLSAATSAEAGRYEASVSNDFGGTFSASARLTVIETNTPPSIAITSPADGSHLILTNAPLVIESVATDPDGTVASVAFFADGLPLGTALTAPFRAEWLDPSPGLHVLQAIATDRQGARGTSAVVQINISFGTSALRLVSTGAVWKYLDTGAEPAAAWRSFEFDDATWRSGPAELGYGDAADGRPEATLIGFGPSPNNKYPTAYFRRSLILSDSASLTNLAVRLLRDDGAVGYLNGVEIFRSNMPTGAIGFATLAAGAINATDETNYFSIPITGVQLRNGTNTLAVEVHQASVTSSDLSFDLELTADRKFAPVILTPPVNVTVTNGGVATFQVVAQGTPPLRYQWFRDETNLLAGATNAVLTLQPATVAQAGGYSVEVTGAFGQVRSAEAILIVITGANLPPVVELTTPTNHARFTAGLPIRLQALATDPDGSIASVAFRVNGALLGSVSTSPYEFVWLNAPLGLHVLQAVATDHSGATTTSRPVNISISSPPGGTTFLVSTGAVWKYLDDGSDQGTDWRATGFDDATWASGPAELGYGDVSEGRPEATVIRFGDNAQQKHLTYYFRHAFTATNVPPLQPLRFDLLRDDGAAVYLNGTEVFRSNLPEGPINFQTTAIAAVSQAEETQYLTTNANAAFLANGTNVLAVEVHQVNRISSDVSFDLALGVSRADPPRITAQPQSLAATNGDAVEFRVSASGLAPLHYQWFRNSTNRLVDATNASLTLSSVTLEEAGTYIVEVRDSVGTTFSDPAVLTVTNRPTNAPPTVALTSPPQGSVFFEQAAIPLSAAATDPDGVITRVEFLADDVRIGETLTPPYAFDWFGATVGTHLLRAVATDNQGATSSSAPVSITVQRHETNQFDLTLISTGAVWKYLDTGVDQGSAWTAPGFNDRPWASGPAELGYGDSADGHPEATTLGFGPDANQKFPTYYFRRAFALTNVVSVTALNLRVQRDDGVVVYLNGTEVFRDNLPTGGISFTNRALKTISNEDETRFLESPVPATLLVDGTNVVAVEIHQVNNTSSDISFDLELTASRPVTPTILAQPTNQTVVRGQTARFAVTATGGQPLTYQWYRNALSPIPNATNDTLIISNAQFVDEGSYSVVVSNPAGSTRSDSAILTVLGAPIIEAQPQNVAVPAGGSAVFSVVAAGAEPLRYQWFYNTNTPVPGANTATLALSPVQLANAGAYSVIVSNLAGAVSSQPAALRVLVTSSIVGISQNHGVVTLTFTTVPGLKYSVDFKDDLNSPPWNLLPAAVKLNGTGNPLSIQDPGPILTRRFYRIRIE